MPVNVIGTLKPKNNGKFPVAEAVDIKVTDDLRLDEALENKADLSTVNFALDNKADKSTTTSLQNQINNIIAPVTEDAEVINAREGADGTNYATLKQRLDAENGSLQSTIKALYLNGVLSVPLNLERGNINASGEYIDSTTRLRSPKLPLIGNYILKNPDGLSWYLIKYLDSSSTIIEWDVTTSEYEFTAENGYTYAFVFRNTDESVLNIKDCTAYLEEATAAESYVDNIVSELQSEINSNTTEIDKIDQDLYASKEYGTWIQGTLSSVDGRIDTSRNDRITETTFYKTSDIEKITFNSDCRIILAYYSQPNESNFISTTTWYADTVSEFTGAYIRIAIKKASEGAITPTDNTGLTINFIPTPVSERFSEITELASEKFSSYPNAAYLCRDGMAENTVPPNSKYAIRSTAKNQYDMIRFSVTKSTDGQYVAVHDVYINNLAVNPDGSSIISQIRTDSLSVSEMNEYDWGLKYGTQYAGLTVPMLDDCLKFASMYNLTVALDIKWELDTTDINNITSMLAKYGQLNAIFFAVSISNMQLLQAKSKKFSYLFAGTYEQMENQSESLQLLLSGYNKIYLAYRPMGDVPTSEVITFAMENGFDIMYSPIEGIDELIELGVNHGITLFECHYIPNIKSTVREYTDSLIDEE